MNDRKNKEWYRTAALENAMALPGERKRRKKTTGKRKRREQDTAKCSSETKFVVFHLFVMTRVKSIRFQVTTFHYKMKETRKRNRKVKAINHKICKW